MSVTDLAGIGPVTAQRLDAAGLGTVEAIAAASIEELTAVPGIGHHVGPRVQAQARELLAARASAAGTSPHRAQGDEKAKVAKAVRRLRRSIPDLAKSKKQAKNLKQSVKRMAAWVDDLDRRKVRKRFLAETKQISEEAKKRTGSKKAAKSLRKHAARIEKAVRKVA